MVEIVAYGQHYFQAVAAFEQACAVRSQLGLPDLDEPSLAKGRIELAKAKERLDARDIPFLPQAQRKGIRDLGSTVMVTSGVERLFQNDLATTHLHLGAAVWGAGAAAGLAAGVLRAPQRREVRRIQAEMSELRKDPTYVRLDRVIDEVVRDRRFNRYLRNVLAASETPEVCAKTLDLVVDDVVEQAVAIRGDLLKRLPSDIREETLKATDPYGLQVQGRPKDPKTGVELESWIARGADEDRSNPLAASLREDTEHWSMIALRHVVLEKTGLDVAAGTRFAAERRSEVDLALN